MARSPGKMIAPAIPQKWWSLGSMFKAIPDRNPRDVPASPIGAWDGQKRTVITYNEAVLAEQAMRHPVVFRCLHKIASSVASAEWYAEVDSRLPVVEQAGARQIKAMNDLLQSPNDRYSRSQLLYWMALNYAVFGRVPFKVGVGAVPPYLATGIYPLITKYVQAITDNRGLVQGYQYGQGEDGVLLPTRARARDTAKAYAHEIARPALDDTLLACQNVTPLNAIGLPAQVVTLLLQRAADTASGHPNTKYIVVAEKTLTEPQKKAAREQLENSQVDGESSGQVLFLYNTKVDIKKLDNDLQDIHSKMPMDDMSRMIVGAFGIPIALIGLGAADAAKFAGNYSESRLSFWQDTLIPEYLDPIATGMTMALAPPGCVIKFDYDKIEAIAEARASRAEKLSKVNFLKRNEKREMCGFEPLSDAEGGNIVDASAAPQASATSPADTNSTGATVQ